ncbi:MAG: hypothetical protein FWB80_01560 [Defluviitaleaceae bacterium]|nr:hypothetical protein [Defluviitaleaceae bacterium]
MYDELSVLWDESDFENARDYSNETVPVWAESSNHTATSQTAALQSAAIFPRPPIGIIPPQQIREVSVTISVAQPGMGQAWILTASHRPHLLGHWFIPGTRVEIFASPAPGFAFSHWAFINPTTGRFTTDRRQSMALTVWGHLAIQAHFVRRAPVPPRPPVAPPARPPVRPPIMPPPARPPAFPVPPIGNLSSEAQFENGQFL